MKLSYLDNILAHFKFAKLLILLGFICFFSIIYLFLDDKHFSGVNIVKETIKEEVIKKKLEKKIKHTETFFNLNKQANIKDVDLEIDKATKRVEQEVKEEDLTVEKIDTSVFQRVFDRVYFSIITSTLLGYGDIYPITAGGKIFSTFVVFIGLGLVAIPTGLVASSLTQALKKE